MAFTGILFDFDGTLADSLGRPLLAYHYALKQVGVEVKIEDEIRKYFGTGADRIFAELIADKALAKRAFRHYLDSKRGQVSDCSWHAGMENLLNEIRARKIPTAIVTGRHSEDLEIIARHLMIESYFSVQICDDHLTQSKPDPEGIRLACSKLGVAPTGILYVGDSLGDLEAAKAAGATSVAALWDKTANVKALTDHADFVAHTPADILKLFLIP